MSLAFLLTSLIVVASPGTGVLYTLAAALTGVAGQHCRGVRLHARHRARDAGRHAAGSPRCCMPARWRSRR